jgi:hypothetical protein
VGDVKPGHGEAASPLLHPAADASHLRAGLHAAEGRRAGRQHCAWGEAGRHQGIWLNDLSKWESGAPHTGRQSGCGTCSSASTCASCRSMRMRGPSREQELHSGCSRRMQP